MRRILFAFSLLALAMPAAAQQAPTHGTTIDRLPGPEDPRDLRPPEQTPNWRGSPEQEQVEATMRRGIETWQQRIDRYQQDAAARQDRAAIRKSERLNRGLLELKQQWEKTRQANNEPGWQTASQHFQESEEQLQRLWNEQVGEAR